MIWLSGLVRGKREGLDLIEQTVSPRARQLLSWLNEHGPSTIRHLEKGVGSNFYTIQPVLDELVSKGFLRKDDKPLAKPGNPIYYHLKPKGVRVIIENWDAISVLERSKATCLDNYSDLRIIANLLDVARESLEPGRVKSALWLILVLGGAALLTIRNPIGLAPLAIAAVLYYDDYVRKRPGLGRPISMNLDRQEQK